MTAAPFLTLASLGGTPLLTPTWGLIVGMLLVLVNGFFVAAEFALVKIRPTQLGPQVVADRPSAKLANKMVANLDAYLSACQLGITLASLALGWIGEPAFAWVVTPVVQLFPGATEANVHQASIVVAFLVITILHIVLGEMAPKTLAIRKPLRTSLWIAWPLWAFYTVSFPAIWILNEASNLLLRLVGLKPASGHAGHISDEAELRLMLATAGEGRLADQKRELLDNIFELSHRITRQVMVPRNEVVYLNTESPIEESLTLARESGHTRFPLCDGDLDRVVGLIHIKDFFHAEQPPSSLLEVKRDIAFVPETLSLDRLLRRMRLEHVYMCAVLDEHGGISGIVTLENVLEEIVGEIQDEFDMEEPELVERGDNVYDVAGSMLIADFENELAMELSERDEDTIAGVVLSELGRQPQSGDRVRIGRMKMEIREIDGNRITRLRATLAIPPTEPEAS